jgi:hypothetical protein
MLLFFLIVFDKFINYLPVVITARSLILKKGEVIKSYGA